MYMATEEDDGKNQHGFPRGYHFVPKPLELVGLLSEALAGRRLPYPLANIFQHIRILDFHPNELYENYKKHEEAGYIYFFSEREFPTQAGSKKRPARCAKGGGWKASGGGKTLKSGGVTVGQKLTMVFYQKRFDGDREPNKTDWGMHEFTKIVGPNDTLADMAVYRLYRMRNGGKSKKAERRVATVSGAGKPSTPTVMALQAVPAHEPFAGTFTANQANALASTSQAQAHDAGVGQAQYYHDYAFAAAATPGPFSWVQPAAAASPAQPHGAAGHVGYVGFTGSPATSQQQSAEQFGYPGLLDWHEPLQIDLPPPAAASSEGYMADEYSNWCATQQVTSEAAAEFAEPDGGVFHDTFTIEELCGGGGQVEEAAAKMTMVIDEGADTNGGTDGSQVQGGDQRVAAAN